MHTVRYTELRSDRSMGSGRIDIPRTSHEACSLDAQRRLPGRWCRPVRHAVALYFVWYNFVKIHKAHNHTGNGRRNH
jgi:hypothetical protein